MIIQEVIRAFLEEKLNENTYNLEFIVGKFIMENDTEFVYNERVGQRLIKKDFIPIYLPSYNGDYVPLHTTESGNIDVPLIAYLIKEENLDFENRVNALSQVLPKLVGTYNKRETYSFITTTSLLSPPSEHITINGKIYIALNFVVSFTFSDKYLLANAIDYYLVDDEENEEFIPYIEAREQRGVTDEAIQILGTTHAKSLIEENVFSTSLVVYEPKSIVTNPLLCALIDSLEDSNGYQQNKKYTLKKVKTRDTDVKTITRECVVVSYNTTMPRGDKNTLSLEFIEGIL